MRFKQIVETTTAGSVATVAQPMMTQTRENVNVPGLKPVQQLMKGKSKKKGPYANSINEGKVKQLTIDLKELTDEEFKKKYSKTKAEIKADMKKVNEDDLSEQDLIVIPGQGRLRRTGFVKQDLDQGEHEGHTLKNSLHTIARAASDLDKRLSVQSEFPEWVSEKIGAAKGMMVTVMDYLISSQEMQQEPDDMAEGEKNTSYMNKQNQDFYNKNPNFKRDDRGIKFVGNQLASIVTPTNKPGQGAKKPMTPFKTQGVAEALDPDTQRLEQEVRDALANGDDYTAKSLVKMAQTAADRNYLRKIIRQEMYGTGPGQGGIMEGDDGQVVFSGTGANGGKYKIIQTGPTDFMIHANGKHIDTYSSLQRAMSVLKNEVPGLTKGVAEANDLGDLRKAAARSRSPEDTQALKRNPDFGKLMQKSVNKHNKAVVKTRQDIGSRIADIGAGGKEYNVKTDAAWDAAKKKVAEGSAPKEKQKTPYRDINSPEYKAAADKQKEKMAKDKEAEPGKKLADKIDNKKK